jgi:hypothetical protein
VTDHNGLCCSSALLACSVAAFEKACNMHSLPCAVF